MQDAKAIYKEFKRRYPKLKLCRLIQVFAGESSYLFAFSSPIPVYGSGYVGTYDIESDSFTLNKGLPLVLNSLGSNVDFSDW